MDLGFVELDEREIEVYELWMAMLDNIEVSIFF
jgi:hypothetical protein